VFPHLRDLPVATLAPAVGSRDIARRIALAMHQRGARTWEDLALGRRTRAALEARFRFGPLLRVAEARTASDGTRKWLFALGDGETIETVLIRGRGNKTLCVSSQAGCALGCRFCATARIGLRRNLTAGEITESVLVSELEAGERITDIVFMGQGEPLHNYDAVMEACANLNHPYGHSISKKRISVSTSGLAPQIRRYTADGHPWRLYLSLHSAIQETRVRLMPIAARHPLPEVLDAMREHQRVREVPWLTLQYIAIPELNMDEAHVDALARALEGMRYILNVIPYNETGAGFRPPTWDEVRAFTAMLRRLRCPVKTRYSAGKQDGFGCGQLSNNTVPTPPTGGHLTAPFGTFTD
jgi:23S rRNA (adenine2503-C2)-methyltransferase